MTHNSPLKVAVVGHTNAGKTSLLRTLLRDDTFGEVSSHAGTTRHVEGASLLLDNIPVIDFVDTPGFEDSIGLITLLETIQAEHRLDRIGSLNWICSEASCYPAFDQEIKVIRQLLCNELYFYVVDVREPLLGKYINELEILSYAARPIIPVLNFTASRNARAGEWKSQLAQLNFHTLVLFDTVAYQEKDEKRLLKQMQTILSDRYDLFEQIIEQHDEQRRHLLDEACRQIAELLIDAGAFYIECDNQPPAITEAQNSLQQQIREADRVCMQSILEVYRFHTTALTSHELAIDQGEWRLDLFDDSNLQRFGIAVGSGAAKGALAGAGFDLLTVGMSLGTGTAVGALAGALLQTGQRYRHELNARIRGYRSVCVADETLRVMMLRQLDLLDKLRRRGHAAMNALSVEAMNAKSLPEAFDAWIKLLRGNPQWSRLNSRRYMQANQERNEFAAELTEALKAIILSRDG